MSGQPSSNSTFYGRRRAVANDNLAKAAGFRSFAEYLETRESMRSIGDLAAEVVKAVRGKMDKRNG